MKNINKIQVYHTIFSKFVGLRFHNKIIDSAYVFPFDEPLKVGLDMFFVHFIIDVVFLDNNKKIVEIKKNFLPYTFYKSKEKVSFVVELPKGYVEKNKLEIGKKLEF